jgi:hypothetical protein
MKIDNSKVKLVFKFQADEWFLCRLSKEEEDRVGWPYSLLFRIDRSEKGKDDDCGIAKIYLDEKEAELAKKNGFSEIVFPL